MLGFNLLDIVAVLAFAFFFFRGANKGFLRMTFSFVSILISLYITRLIYQPVSAFLRDSTPIYELLKTRIISVLGLGELIENYIAQGETAVLNNLPLPQILLRQLSENNTSAMWMTLGVTTLEEYVGSFLAGLCINIIALILVFVVAITLTNIIAGVLDIISKLPIIRTFDKLGGLLIGALIGLFAVWCVVTLYLTLFINLSFSDGSTFNTSIVGQYLYTHGLLLRGFIY